MSTADAWIVIAGSLWGILSLVGLATIWFVNLPVGSKSLLFGVHQFLWHPITVYIAWVKLYRKRPTWRETICIIVHDWGYWGCQTMDGEDGFLHTSVGAAIVYYLFRGKYAKEMEQLVLLHSRHFAISIEKEPSALCWPDKLSMMYDPMWFYLFRARLSGEINEYMTNAKRKRFIAPTDSQEFWLNKLRLHLAKLSKTEAQQYVVQ